MHGQYTAYGVGINKTKKSELERSLGNTTVSTVPLQGTFCPRLTRAMKVRLTACIARTVFVGEAAC